MVSIKVEIGKEKKPKSLGDIPKGHVVELVGYWPLFLVVGKTLDTPVGETQVVNVGNSKPKQEKENFARGEVGNFFPYPNTMSVSNDHGPIYIVDED